MRLLLYDNHENLLAIIKGYGSVEREINVYDELKVDIPRTAKSVDLLKRTMKIGVPYPRTDKYQLFKVETAKLNGNPLSVTAIDSAADDLDTQYLIRDKRFVNVPLNQVLPVVFEHTTWKYKQFAPNNDLEVISFYRISPKEALKKVEEVYGVEVRFLYTVQGNRIAEKICEIHQQIGRVTNLRLVQGKNVTSVDYTQDQTQLYTAAMGRGAGLAMTDEDGNATGGYSRSIEFTDVVWSKAKGDPVDKPAGQDYVEIPEATAKYGWLDANGKRQPRIAKFEFQDEQDVSKLLKETYEKLVPLSKPQTVVESTVAKIGQRVELGDDVTVVIYEPYKLTYKARVIKISDNPDNQSLSTVTVGFSTVERQAEREYQQEQNIDNNKTDFNQSLSDLKEKTDYKFTEVDKKADEQTRKAQEAIRKIEEDTAKQIDDAKQKIADFVGRNSKGSPLEFYDSNNQIVAGIPPVAYIKSRDNSFTLNSNGFNWGNRVLGGNGMLYADEIYGKTITGYTVNAAHINTATITGATISGSVYINSNNGSAAAVMSADNGFSYTSSGGGSVKIDGGPEMYATGINLASGNKIYFGGTALTEADVQKLHRLKG